jgi:hypothetical protein
MTDLHARDLARRPLTCSTSFFSEPWENDLESTGDVTLDELSAVSGASLADTLPDCGGRGFDLDFEHAVVDHSPPCTSAVPVAPAYFVEVFAPFRAPTLLAVRGTLGAAHEVADAIDPRSADIVIRELILPWEPASECHQLDTMRSWRRDGAGAWRLTSAPRLRTID